MIELIKLIIPSRFVGEVTDVALLVNYKDQTSSLFMPEDFEDTFELKKVLQELFRIDVKEVKFSKDRLPYRNNRAFNHAAFINNINRQLNELGYTATIHHLYHTCVYLAIQTLNQSSNRVFDYEKSSLITTSALFFIDTKDYSLIESDFERFEEYEIEYHIRNNADFMKNVKRGDIDNIAALKKIVQSEIDLLKEVHYE